MAYFEQLELGFVLGALALLLVGERGAGASDPGVEGVEIGEHLGHALALLLVPLLQHPPPNSWPGMSQAEVLDTRWLTQPMKRGATNS